MSPHRRTTVPNFYRLFRHKTETRTGKDFNTFPLKLPCQKLRSLRECLNSSESHRTLSHVKELQRTQVDLALDGEKYMFSSRWQHTAASGALPHPLRGWLLRHAYDLASPAGNILELCLPSARFS